MPRLNYGTLLENLVVLECVRMCLEHVTPVGPPLGFVTSFAMPALTECWRKPTEEAGSPWFSHEYLLSLTLEPYPSDSLQGIWSLCLNNAPKLPVARYYQREGLLVYPSAGPNGALLAAMLAVESGRPIALWTNDDAERYAVDTGRAGDSARRQDPLAAAGALLGADTKGTTTSETGLFPATISHLDEWLLAGAGKGTTVRVGFLDPDNYAEGSTQVSPGDHRRWLRVLAAGGVGVLSVMFSGCQNRGPGNAARDARLASFHADEVDSYPDSLVFELGSFQTGVKIRWPEESRSAAVADLRQRIEAVWRGWHPLMHALTVHRNGLPSA